MKQISLEAFMLRNDQYLSELSFEIGMDYGQIKELCEKQFKKNSIFEDEDGAQSLRQSFKTEEIALLKACIDYEYAFQTRKELYRLAGIVKESAGDHIRKRLIRRDLLHVERFNFGYGGGDCLKTFATPKAYKLLGVKLVDQGDLIDNGRIRLEGFAHRFIKRLLATHITDCGVFLEKKIGGKRIDVVLINGQNLTAVEIITPTCAFQQRLNVKHNLSQTEISRHVLLCSNGAVRKALIKNLSEYFSPDDLRRVSIVLLNHFICKEVFINHA